MKTTKYIPIIMAALGLLMVSGCADENRCSGPDCPDVPPDFHVRSDYFGASVSPPYHYDYCITLSSTGRDTISFHPGYAGGPTWIETFDASPIALHRLYELMLERNIFRIMWVRIEDHLVGGESRRLMIVSNGHLFNVPPWVRDEEAIHPVYGAIDSLVPAAIWDDLWLRRERFIQDYPK